jgi:hypothetical protein
MVQLVKTYLLQNNSISIPGLGTIYVERIPAQSDFVNRQLLPPAYHFRFDKYFDAPGKEFFTYLAAKNNVEDYEAIKMYNEWALQLRNGISADHATVLEGLGSLKRDMSGEVIFEASGNQDMYSQPVAAERIIRTNAKHTMIVGDKEVTNVEMSDYLQDDGRRKKTSWWVYALILAAAALAAIFFHFYTSGGAAPFGNGQTINAK